MQMKNLAVLVALPMALVACGGDSGGSSSGGGIVAPGASISSQFIDAPVKGLKVQKTSGDGETGANGVFSCKAGEELNFWLKEINGKGIKVGTANCGSKIYIDDLAGVNPDIAGALIQSLSTGDHATRKELDLTAFNATSFDLHATIGGIGSLANDNDIDTLITQVKAVAADLPVEPVKISDARTHINSNLPAQEDDVLEDIALGGEHTLRLTPHASNPEGYCWENVQVKVQLAPITVGEGKKAYRFNVTEYLAWENSADAPNVSSCDGQEHEAGTGTDIWYQCLSTPVSKIMTGRSVSGSKYEAYSFSIPEGATAICKHDEGYEFNYQPSLGVQCMTDGETPVLAAKALTLDVGQGWNFNIAVTNSSYTVSFTENAVDIGATLDGNGKATGYTQYKFNCSYSLVETLDESVED